MRDYGKVYTSFWTSETTRGLSDRGRVLAIYLLSSPHSNMIGCFRVPDGYVAEDLNWSLETVSKGFDELLNAGFATRDSVSKWVCVHQFLAWNEIENPNQGVSAIKLTDQIPDSFCAKGRVLRSLHDSVGRFKDKVRNDVWSRFETLVERFRNQEQEQEQEQDGSAPPASPATRAKKAESEESENETELQAACRETWAAYCDAFFNRYGTMPVRNKTVNSQVKNFVQRLGYVESPAVAAFYVQHPQSFYVKSKHQFGMALKDAEGLRTEWATNRTVTDTQARQGDRMAANANSADEAMRILEAQGAA